MERCDILKDDAWIVVNSFEELESNTFKALREHINKRCIGVGPLLPTKYLGLATRDGEDGITSIFEDEAKCLEWLDDNKVPNSVIYISFGSGSAFVLSQGDFEELSRGVEESKQLFLWAHDHTKLSEVSMDSFEAFKERTKLKGQGLVIHWASQMDVLSHPSVGAFLTHCGWNSVMEAICAGVPMLGLPKGAEQTLNCKLFTEDLKIGLPLRDAIDGDTFTCNGVADKVVRILRDEGMRNRARSFKDAALHAAAFTTTNMEKLLTFINLPKMKSRNR